MALFPSWPLPFVPQHMTPPPVVIAQAEFIPIDTAVAPPMKPASSTGTGLEASAVPFPSSPLPL